MEFCPDYRNVEKAARNICPDRLPLYEHLICGEVMTELLGRQLCCDDLDAYYSDYCEFYRKNGYDTVTFEACITSVMPENGCLGAHRESSIKTMDDLLKYPFDDIPEYFFQTYAPHFEALRKAMPAGMKAIGGVGNGIFECVQDIIGYMNLCFMSADDPEMYDEVFKRVGQTNVKIWQRFMKEYGDIFCVLRFGDDLGYKSNTMLSKADICKYIIPQYRQITDLVHSYGKPFLLHSCGNLFSVMDELICDGGIDAKHSNEDQIAPFSSWTDRYGDRIGNFGGVDTDILCRCDEKQIREYTLDVLNRCADKGGVAIGSGNSIPNYVPFSGYMAMVETVREFRGDTK